MLEIFRSVDYSRSYDEHQFNTYLGVMRTLYRKTQVSPTIVGLVHSVTKIMISDCP